MQKFTRYVQTACRNLHVFFLWFQTSCLEQNYSNNFAYNFTVPLEWTSWCCMIGNYWIEENWKYTWKYAGVDVVPCVQQIYFRAVSFCLESKYKPGKHQENNLYTVVNFIGFFSHYLETILSLERFWETYSEAVPRVMSILFLLTILIYLKIINSEYCFDILPNSQNKDQITWGNW